MTEASSICRIRLSFSTTASTSNWKARGIAVLLQISRRDDPIGFRWAGTRSGSTVRHYPKLTLLVSQHLTLPVNWTYPGFVEDESLGSGSLALRHVSVA